MIIKHSLPSLLHIHVYIHDAAEVDIHDPNLRSEGGEELSWIPRNSAEFRLTDLDLANQKPRLCDAMLGQAVFLLTDCHELWFRSTQSMEFSWIPGNSADTPAAGIQLNSREFSWIPWIEKEKPGGFDQICYVSKSFVVKFTTTTEQYKRKRRWKNTNLDWTT